jgi:30S ribosomal protein S31
MGKGDIKTKRGKLFAGSFGKKRKKGQKNKLSHASIPQVKKETSTPPVKEKKSATEVKPKSAAKENKDIPVANAKVELKASKEVTEPGKDEGNSKKEDKKPS